MTSYVIDKKLKEYAYKCFTKEPGYSLEKARLLFPDYYLKISAYYLAFKSEVSVELARKSKAVMNLNIIKDLTLINDYYKKVLSTKDTVKPFAIRNDRDMQIFVNYQKGVHDNNTRLLDNVIKETKKWGVYKMPLVQELCKNISEMIELGKQNLYFTENKLHGKQ